MINNNLVEYSLLDLDGTLLPVDIDDFLQDYFRLLTSEFSDLAPPEEFINQLLGATEKMIANPGKMTNEEVFKEAFFSRLEIVEAREEIMDRFNKFYREKFPTLRQEEYSAGRGKELVNLLLEQGMNLVLATNPIFPEIAIRERIRWTGLDPDVFTYITNYENMHYAKPNPQYYSEIMEKVSCTPKKCIMIGNDLQEDMAAGEVGITTFLVEDFLRGGEKQGFEPDWRGSFAELLAYFNPEE
ncbi:MAG: HAD family hydrolase [Bacillota bacterium]